MSKLFEHTVINGLVMRNRFVRSATWEGMAADDGACTPELAVLMGRLAQGGVGLIITGHAYVVQSGQAGERQLGIYDDRLVDGLRDMVQAVHDSGGRIVAQLAHSGIFADPALTGNPPLGPSTIDGATKHAIREMTPTDIEEVVTTFGRAAVRAKSAGFDGVQIHAAHGYLLSQFLSPYFNHRNDEYGGDIHARARIVVDILKDIRSRVGDRYPILIKMNCRDYLDGGQPLEDAVAAASLFAEAGLDAVEVSGGTGLSGRQNPVRTNIQKEEDEAYFQDASYFFKERLRLPVILVGGIRSFSVAEALVDQSIADYISMSRPFIREPDLIMRWEAGAREKTACLSDSRCFVAARSTGPIHCVMEKRRSTP